MKGSKTKRGENSWLIRIYAGIDSSTGKQKYIQETVCGNEKTADARIAEVITLLNKGDWVDPSKLTFGEFMEQWLDSYVKTSTSEGTFEWYNGLVENHIKTSPISRITVVKLSALDIQNFIAKKTSDKKMTDKNKKLAPKTVREILAMIKLALKFACIWRIIKDNPAQYVVPPKIPRPKTRELTIEQTEKFLMVAQEDKYYLIYLLAIYTGMRLGELRGIRWQDVDLKKCTISIRQTIRKDGNSAIFKDPKTEGSIAQVNFDPAFSPLFDEQKKLQEAAQLAYGLGYKKELDLVFTSKNGGPIKRRNLVDEHFYTLLKKADIPKMRFHDLRHSCATLLLQAGVHPRLIQERLRHSDIRTTMNRYSHVLPTMQKEVDAKMSSILGFKAIQENKNN